MPARLRIALTGGGTGGHLFPLAATADTLLTLGRGEIELRYFGPGSPWNEAIAARDIPVLHVAGAKLRRYAALENFLDVFKFGFGLLEALVKLYVWMPDAVFSKGGPGALPVVLAAAWYRIPIVIHESDAVPGLTNRISAKFAKRIAVSFSSAAAYFPERKVVITGNPVRSLIAQTKMPREIAKSQLGFDREVPLLLVLGGSQGARALNEFIERALPVLTASLQIFHQTGTSSERPSPGGGGGRYRAQPFLDEREMATALRAADVVLTRAGAGAIFECAAAGVPAILVPLASGANDHQRANAAEYAASGAAIVLEENNLTPNLVMAEVKKLLADEARQKLMGERARAFYRPDAAEIIAREIITAAGATVQ